MQAGSYTLALGSGISPLDAQSKGIKTILTVDKVGAWSFLYLTYSLGGFFEHQYRISAFFTFRILRPAGAQSLSHAGPTALPWIKVQAMVGAFGLCPSQPRDRFSFPSPASADSILCAFQRYFLSFLRGSTSPRNKSLLSLRLGQRNNSYGFHSKEAHPLASRRTIILF